MSGKSAAVQIFRYPLGARKFMLISSVLSLATIWVVLQSSSISRGDVAVFLCVVMLAIYGNLEINLTEVRLDDARVTNRSLWQTQTLRWTEIEEFVCFSRLFLLRGPRGKPQIRWFRGDFGFALEPFDELRESVLARVQSLVYEKWKAKTDHSYRYPPLSMLQGIAYLIVAGLIALVFVIAPIQREVFGLDQAAYLIGSLLIVGFFFVRDLRKTRRSLVASERGLQESNGQSIFVPWQEIGDVHVREPILGCGSLVVHGKNQKLTIPVRMRGAGEVFFLLNTRGKPQITYGHEV